MLNLEFINTLLSAAKYIEEDGVDGFNKASEIVGTEAAAGLLIGSLVTGYNHERAYPIPLDITNKIIKDLYKSNLIKA